MTKIKWHVIHTLALLVIWLSGVLAAEAQTRTVHLYYTDPQGTVLAKTDAQGTILARYDYRPYGGVVNGNGPNGPGYTGHVQDPETGLVYMQARYYDPAGRFPSPDPVGPSPGNVYSFNRYVYANDNPARYIDPDGRTCTEANKT
jgi:RHS repeat-associated protein